MPRCTKKVLFIIFTVSLAFVFAGCGGNKTTQQPFQYRSNLKKKVAVVPFVNRTSFAKKDLGPRMAAYMSSALGTSRNLLIVNPEKVQQYISEQGLPLPLTQNTAVLLGRSLGVNAVVLGTVAKVETDIKKVGWLPFIPLLRNKKPVVSVELILKVVDVANGVSIMADIASSVEKMDLDDDLALENPGSKIKVDSEVAREALAEAALDLTKEVFKVLKRTPWKGFVDNVSESTVRLSAGGDVGVRRGQQFVVYTVDDKITSSTGRVYAAPGSIKALLEVTNVLSTTSKAKIVSGQVHAGDTVYAAGS